MSVDISKLILYSPDNAFKNVNSYTGSLVMPTLVPAGGVVTVTSEITLSDVPIFTELFCYFVEATDALYGSTTAQWYSTNIAGNFGIGIHEIAPVDVWLNCAVYPVISGNTVTITGDVFNGGAGDATFVALTIPFIFIEYTTAS